jgi:colicin import membrane protein/protein TonB
VSPPFVTALNQRDRLWPAVLASVAVHVAAFSLALKVSSAPELVLEQTPIKARLVRLGEKKPEQLLPQKEAPPPPPEPAPATPPPVVADSPPPPTDKPPAPAAPTAAPAPARAPSPRPSPRSPANGAGTSINDLLARAEQRVKREQWGDPSGDAQGDSDEGTEGERYLALLTRAVKENYHLPATISDKERLSLVAVAIVWIEPDGTISQFKLVRPSGNAAFDSALERAVRATRAPPPPENQRDVFRRTGAQVTFNI